MSFSRLFFRRNLIRDNIPKLFEQRIPASSVAVNINVNRFRIPHNNSRSFMNHSSNCTNINKSSPWSCICHRSLTVGSSGNNSPLDRGNALLDYSMELFNKLCHSSPTQLFHYSNYALLGLTPVAVLLSPSFFNIPIDLALGIIIPYHAHQGTVGIIEDYVPRPNQKLVKAILVVATGLATIGLLKINLCGAGITESVKSLWRSPSEEALASKNKTLRTRTPALITSTDNKSKPIAVTDESKSKKSSKNE